MRFPPDRACAQPVDAILTLAHKMGMRTVAEGVETVQQLQYLQAQGCDECQGYLFAKP
ncbi:hypothetical protein GCM10028785_25270 [Hydrogenophaga soli]